MIFSLFFISCSIVLGIFSLAPAYILSFSEKKEIMQKLESSNRDRRENGTEAIMKDLKKSNTQIKSIKSYDKSLIFSDIIALIISHKNSGIYINSLQFQKSSDPESKLREMIVQGKAITRESLVSFKNKLELEEKISKVELPVSDLAKSKNISFSIKLSL